MDQVDGTRTDYRPEQRCVYYCITLPPGPHILELRLDYESPTHHVRTDGSLQKSIELEPGQSYTLLDLTAGIRRGRTFSPWLLHGPPEDEDIEWQRPSGE